MAKKKKRLKHNGIPILPGAKERGPLDSNCHLCGLPTLRKSHVRPGHPLAWTRDHLIPLSRGGPAARKNTAPAHQICNCLRQNKLLADLSTEFRLALRSRVQTIAGQDMDLPTKALKEIMKAYDHESNP